MIFNEMKNQAIDLLEKIQQQAFNVELSNGTLPKEKFMFYLYQDYLYLTDFGKAISITAGKLNNHKHIQAYLKFAIEVIDSERDLHNQYFKGYQSPSRSIKQAPGCFMYTNYLLRMASEATTEESIAALLPCFWVYREVGQSIALKNKAGTNPYQEWIDLYSSERFHENVSLAIDICNDVGKSASPSLQNKMIEAFIIATKMEWIFWNSAYEMERWEV